MRRTFRVFFRILPWAILLAIASYLVFAEGWKDLLMGRYQRKARTFFENTDEVTEVRVYRLAGKEDQSSKETFPIRPYHMEQTVYGSVTLIGSELAEFKDLWRSQQPDEWKQALCHDPPYGFRLYRGSKLVTETSICWHCNNFYFEFWPFGSTWYGFDAESKAGKELLDFCDKRLPYARWEKKPKPTP
jgi:hypothetical protein